MEGRRVKFTIPGAPRTKKTSQRIVTRKSTGKPFILASKQTKGWTENAVGHLRAQAWAMGMKTPEQAEVNCRALIYRARRQGDAVNFYQAIADALQEAGVVENDRLIVAWDGSRLLADKDDPRVEIELTPMAPEPRALPEGIPVALRLRPRVGEHRRGAMVGWAVVRAVEGDGYLAMVFYAGFDGAASGVLSVREFNMAHPRRIPSGKRFAQGAQAQ
jgi:Holliday junction resolvase RusA-like endonuclease